MKRRAVLFGLIAITGANTQLRVEAAPQPLTIIHHQWLRRQLARK